MTARLFPISGKLSKNEEAFTIVVCGLGRSGTTMVARTLQALGIDMGKSLTPKSCEDKILQQAIKSNDFESFSNYCLTRDQTANVWAFKVPAFRGKLMAWSHCLRRPRAIITFRDPLAITLSNLNYLGLDDSELVKLLGKCAHGNLALAKLVKHCNFPVMLVSYEKALKNPTHFVECLANYCNVVASASRIDEVASENIKPKDSRYTGDS